MVGCTNKVGSTLKTQLRKPVLRMEKDLVQLETAFLVASCYLLRYCRVADHQHRASILTKLLFTMTNMPEPKSSTKLGLWSPGWLAGAWPCSSSSSHPQTLCSTSSTFTFTSYGWKSATVYIPSSTWTLVIFPNSCTLDDTRKFLSTFRPRFHVLNGIRHSRLWERTIG